jgi:UDP-N-acetylmuramate dehydrogenase
MAEVTDRWQADVSASSITTMKAGGTARYVTRPSTLEELREDLAEAARQHLAVRVLGGGSNVVLPDGVMNTLVIIPSAKHCGQFAPPQPYSEEPFITQDVRYRTEEGFLNLEGGIQKLPGEPCFVRMGAGVAWGQAVMWALTQQMVGLHWYARIPCAVGGAVYNNIHGEKHFISEVVQEVTSINQHGELRTWKPSELQFSYDFSVFHTLSAEVIWEVVFKLRGVSEAEVALAKDRYLKWTKAKAEVQPSGANCGSVFQNLPPEYADILGTGMTAAGWYVDHAGCLGWEEGDMQVYPGHGNFIINRGAGTQAQFLALVQRVRQQVHEQYGVWLLPEVECLTTEGKSIQW